MHTHARHVYIAMVDVCLLCAVSDGGCDHACSYTHTHACTHAYPSRINNIHISCSCVQYTTGGAAATTHSRL